MQSSSTDDMIAQIFGLDPQEQDQVVAAILWSKNYTLPSNGSLLKPQAAGILTPLSPAPSERLVTLGSAQHTLNYPLDLLLSRTFTGGVISHDDTPLGYDQFCTDLGVGYRHDADGVYSDDAMQVSTPDSDSENSREDTIRHHSEGTVTNWDIVTEKSIRMDKKAGKKPRRKFLIAEALHDNCKRERRKAQNRAAQVAFRQRRSQRFKDLEAKIAEVEKMSETKTRHIAWLQAKSDVLKTRCKTYKELLSTLQEGWRSNVGSTEEGARWDLIDWSLQS